MFLMLVSKIPRQMENNISCCSKMQHCVLTVLHFTKTIFFIFPDEVMKKSTPECSTVRNMRLNWMGSRTNTFGLY